MSGATQDASANANTAQSTTDDSTDQEPQITSPLIRYNPWEAELARILITEDQIQKRCRELANQISEDSDKIGAKKLILVGVLKGAYMFLSDLARRLSIRHIVDFVAVSSYGKSVSQGEVRIVMDMREPVGGQHIVLVEDVIDSGATLKFLVSFLQARRPASLRTAALVKKVREKQPEIEVDYLGFDLPDVWLVGYGLDFAEEHRTHAFIAELKPEVYKK